MKSIRLSLPGKALVCAFVGLLTTAGVALAQDYPSKPIRWVMPYPPGGGGDIVARLLAQKLSENIGHPMLVDNRPGAAGTLGTDAVAKASPDGYTLSFGTNSTHAIVASLYQNLPYDPARDFAPVTNLVAVTNVLVTHPSVAAKSVPELIALAKQKPNALVYASAGSGSNAHLSMELLKTMAGVDALHTPYKGIGPALGDLLAGRVHMMISNVPPVEGHIKNGKLRAIATTGKQRAPSMPEVPTVDEAGVKGYESDAWWAVFAPAGTPKPVIDKLNAEFVRVLRAPDVQRRLGELGLVPIGSSPEQLAATVRADIARWAAVVKKSGAKIE